jgi:TPR repeat protein
MGMQKKGSLLFRAGFTVLFFCFSAEFSSGAPVNPTKSEKVIPFEPINAKKSSGSSKSSSSSETKAESSTKSQSSTSKPIAWTWDKPYVPTKEVVELEKRANEGDQRAQAEMSLRYRSGEGVTVDLTRALRACESNPHPISRYTLARMLFHGEGVETDLQRAERLLSETYEPLRLLSDEGDSLATALIGIYFEEGWAGVSKDLADAERLYRKSHAAGCAFGTVALGKLLLITSESKPQEGRALLRLAAQKGSGTALKALTNEAMANDRWKSGEPTDQTISDLNLLASLGDTIALFLLSHPLTLDKHKDYTKAFKILETLKAKTPESERNKLNYRYALHYLNGWGTSKNYQLGFQLALEGAMSGYWACCAVLCQAYGMGHGTPKNYTTAYAWGLVAAGRNKINEESLRWYEVNLAPQQIAEAQKLAQSLNSEIERNKSQGTSSSSASDSAQNKSAASGTGFFLSENGYIATNFHVVSGAKKISVRTANGEMGAVMVLADQVNDVAVIKAPVLGKPLPIGDVSAVVAGTPVYTVGFPNPVVQGFEPKLTKGDINSTTGLKDDPRMFQISVPVQPGNSGGPLLNERGTVIGIITAQLNSLNALVTSGSLPQNVNYALKVNYLKPLIESNRELREAADGSKSKEKEAKPPETAMESVLLILVEK